MNRLPVVVMTLVALCGCRTPARHAALFEAAACNADKAACVERVLDAHGGRERALKFRYATYTLRDHWDSGARSLAMPWPEETADIEMASDRLGYSVAMTLGGTPYALGVDARGAWATGGKKGLPTVAARYGAGTAFVLGMPFRLLDPGTRIVEAKAARFQGRDTIALEVVWASDVSRTPGDRWLVHINPFDYALDGVTYFAAEYKLTVEVRFDRLLKVGGVLIPSYAVVSLWPLALRFHVVELLQAQLHTAPPPSLIQGPADADRSGEKWRPVR